MILDVADRPGPGLTPAVLCAKRHDYTAPAPRQPPVRWEAGAPAAGTIAAGLYVCAAVEGSEGERARHHRPSIREVSPR